MDMGNLEQDWTDTAEETNHMGPKSKRIEMKSNWLLKSFKITLFTAILSLEEDALMSLTTLL